jgi:ABC-2 type transport system ATP-binding protein/lipopolysaccharide transport system ATP-binding protein
VKILGETVIKVENVGLQYHLNKEKVDNLKEYVIKFLKRDLKFKKFWAVRGVSFELEKGDKFGIIGLNGAGKSTLLKMISGVIKPTEGTIEIKGNIVPLLELGSGFDSEYTGRENIFLKGSLLGYSQKYLEDKFDEIVEFSELGDFIDIPIKNYSTGMMARLAFSIATVVEPKIMILDEVLSVGDAKFREKSQDRMNSLLNEDVTVLFVSHSLHQVRKLCNKVIWLEHGEVLMQGPSEEICDKYQEWIMSKQTIVVTKSEPAKDDVMVPVDKPLTITFNEKIKAGTEYIEIVSRTGELIPNKRTINGDTLTLTLYNPLQYNTEYYLHLHSGAVVTEKDEHPLNPYSISFKTRNK